MDKRYLILIIVALTVIISGCSGVDGDDYQDAPEEIQDGSLDYQDYKEADCPYLEGSLDQETMDKCNEWIRNQTDTPTSI